MEQPVKGEAKRFNLADYKDRVEFIENVQQEIERFFRSQHPLGEMIFLYPGEKQQSMRLTSRARKTEALNAVPHFFVHRTLKSMIGAEIIYR